MRKRKRHKKNYKIRGLERRRSAGRGAITIIVKEINTTEERPSLLLNKWQGSFRPRLNPVKLLTREREPRVVSASRKQQQMKAAAAAGVQGSVDPSRVGSLTWQYHSCGAGFRGMKDARVKGL